MKVGQEDAGDRVKRDVRAIESDDDVAADVEDQLLDACLDERARAEPLCRRHRRAGAEKHDAEQVVLGLRRSRLDQRGRQNQRCRNSKSTRTSHHRAASRSTYITWWRSCATCSI